MNTKLLTVLAVMAMNITTIAQQTIEDVTLAATFKAGEKTLNLNGGGLREKYFLDLYVGGLYVETKTSDAQQVIESNEMMSIQLNIISNLITSEKMIESTEEGFEKSTNGKQEEYRKDIDLFMAAFYEETKDGDVFDILYNPATGIEVSKNGIKTTTVGDLAFKKALFGIWFCDDPADKDLKEGMLGL